MENKQRIKEALHNIKKLEVMFEKKASNTCVFTFGRFNPFTTGHLQVAKTVADTAIKNNADAYFFASKTQNNEKDPLSFGEKLPLIQSALKDNLLDQIVVDEDPNVKTVFDIARKLDEYGYTHIIGVFGSDRGELEPLLLKYNGMPDRKGNILYTFESIQFVSAGERDESSEDSIKSMSASKARAFALAGDYASFRASIPVKDEDLVKNIYGIIRQRVGGLETLNEETTIDPERLEKIIAKLKLQVRKKSSAYTWEIENPNAEDKNDRFEKAKALQKVLGGDLVRSNKDLKIGGYTLRFKDPEGINKKDPMESEQGAINSFSSTLESILVATGKEYAILKDPFGNTYKITGVENTEGTPKSDFHLLGIDGEPVFWISHKKGKTAKDFQQWSGVTKVSSEDIYSHPETISFVKKITKKYGYDIQPGTSAARAIEDNDLMCLSIYGKDYYSKVFGINNVQVCVQGDGENIGFEVAKGNTIKIKASHIAWNGDTMDVNYEPVFFMSYRADNTQVIYNGEKITNCRIMIQSRAKSLAKDII